MQTSQIRQVALLRKEFREPAKNRKDVEYEEKGKKKKESGNDISSCRLTSIR